MQPSEQPDDGKALAWDVAIQAEVDEFS